MRYLNWKCAVVSLLMMQSFGSVALARPWLVTFSTEKGPPFQFIATIDTPTTGSTISGSFSTPEGESTGFFNTESASENFSSFNAFQSWASSAGPWPMTAIQNGVTSKYTFSPDFSGIDGNSLVSATVTSPTNPIYNSQPTFEWSDSGPINEIGVQFFNSSGTVDYLQYLPTSQTMWQIPSSVPPGAYTFDIIVSQIVPQVPLNPTLISGPDLNFPSSTNFAYGDGVEATYTVVPEPSALCLLVAPMIFAMRRPRRACNSK